MKDVLFVCNDVVGRKMAGPAIRCVEMAKSFALNYKVTVAAAKLDDDLDFPFAFIPLNDPSFRRIVENCDVVIVQGDALVRFPFIKNTKGVLIADLYCPIPLEYHQSSDGISDDIRLATGAYVVGVMNEQLAYADHFLCASEKQRDFWLGALTMSSRVNSKRWPLANRAKISELISLVPFGMPDANPKQESNPVRDQFGLSKEDFVLLWGGGVYQWFDPLTIIRAVDKLVKSGEPVHLVFMGITHPNPDINQHDMCREAISLADELGLRDYFVHFNFGWANYEQRQNYFMDADVGVSAHFDSPETRFAFRTRMLDYLWCSLPIIATRGDVFGDAVVAEKLGFTVEYEDVDGWVNALRTMKKDREFRGECVKNVNNFRECYRWRVVAQPLMKLCADAMPSDDRKYARSLFSTKVGRPGISKRLRHVYAMGGFRLVAKTTLRRLGRIFMGVGS